LSKDVIKCNKLGGQTLFFFFLSNSKVDPSGYFREEGVPNHNQLTSGILQGSVLGPFIFTHITYLSFKHTDFPAKQVINSSI